MCVCAQSLFVTPQAVACQPPLSIGLSRQEYWSRLPFPPPGDLPCPGIKPASPSSPALQAFFTAEPQETLVTGMCFVKRYGMYILFLRVLITAL